MPLRDGFKERGECRNYDPELWWPNGATGDEAIKAELAKSICQQCPVKLDCLSYAIEHRQFFGIWGATTEEERRNDRREARRIMSERVDRLAQAGVASM